jgi:hypothetical protein
MVLLILVALVWGAPIALVLVMALGSLISLKFRNFCEEQLFGTGAPSAGSSRGAMAAGEVRPAPQLAGGDVLDTRVRALAMTERPLEWLSPMPEADLDFRDIREAGAASGLSLIKETIGD